MIEKLIRYAFLNLLEKIPANKKYNPLALLSKNVKITHFI